jgi:hypothetical protein
MCPVHATPHDPTAEHTSTTPTATADERVYELVSLCDLGVRDACGGRTNRQRRQRKFPLLPDNVA